MGGPERTLSRSETASVTVIVCAASLASLLLHLVLLNSQILSDEPFYVAAAETILNHTSCGTLSNLASLQPCNLEHPPLAKLFMAASISVFGNDDLGARLPSIIAGVMSIPIASWLAWSLSKGNVKVTIAAAILLSANPALFVISSVGMLDGIEVLFGLLGFAIYFSSIGQSSSSRSLAAGAMIGLAILSKEVAVYFLAGLVVYLLATRRYREAIYVLGAATVVVFLVLWAYDIAYSPFTNPIQHLLFILSVDFRLRDQGGYAVSPVTWLFQERMALLWLLALIWIPLTVILVVRKPRPQTALLSFALLLFTVVFGALALLYYLDGRQEYLFYSVQVVPALVLGASGLFGGKRMPPHALIVLTFVSLVLFSYSIAHGTSVYFVVP